MEEEIIEKLVYLRGQHKELDDEIYSLESSAFIDRLAVQRLKRKKLEVKDMIARLESSMHPDMIA